MRVPAVRERGCEMKKALDFKLLKRLYTFIKPNRRYLILSLAFSTVSVLAALFATVLAGKGVDCIVGKGDVDFPRLARVVIAIAAVVRMAGEHLHAEAYLPHCARYTQPIYRKSGKSAAFLSRFQG